MKKLGLVLLFLVSLSLSGGTILWDDDMPAYTEMTVGFTSQSEIKRDEDIRPYFPKVIFNDQIFKSKLVVSFEKEPRTFTNLLAIRMIKTSETEKVLGSFKMSENVLWAKRVLGHKSLGFDPREYVPRNDPQYVKQSHHKVMQNDLAWDLTKGEGVIVAITDDGANLKHPDLMEGLWTNPGEIPDNGIDDDLNGYVDDVTGWNFIHDNNNNHEKRLGHGTHVTGIVGARIDNGVGVVGSAPESVIMPLKFFESFEAPREWSSLVICESYVYAIENGAKIITTSYNIDAYLHDEVYQLALDYAYKKGVLVFNSSGNNGLDDPVRSDINKLLLVGGTQVANGKVDVVGQGSNYGIGIDIFAPGDDIYSTSVSGEYIVQSGTSMASPNAASVAALIWSQNPDYTHEQVAAALLYGCEDIEGKNKPQYKFKLGVGRVNSYKSLTQSTLGPVIRRVIETSAIKIIIQVNNVFLKETFDADSFQLKNINTGEIIPLKMMNEYFYGTNQVEFQFGFALKKGKYEFIALSSKLKDPFGNPLRGGDFVYPFAI